ncbi:MAG: prephenate dehydrogenase [Gemmatimonas sp.]
MMEDDFRSVAIVGLGLIGGSLARDLAERGVHVRAYDADPHHLRSALRDGFVAEPMDATLGGVCDAEIVIVAVPVDAATEVLRRIAPYAGNAKLITDVGSTKSRIVALAGELGLGGRFVGSHPMAGDHRSGWDASRTGLFANARVYICPPGETSSVVVELAAEFWRRLGATPEMLSAEDHDEQLAWTSHLPHMVSTALALALARTGIRRDDLGPGGRDVTRLAGGSPDVWTAIARDNAAALDAALATAEREISEIRGALARADTTNLHKRFAAARAWFDV